MKCVDALNFNVRYYCDKAVIVTVTAIVVLALRILIPITILRWRITGAIASMLLDAIDVIIVDIRASIFGEKPGLGSHYQTYDKWLDMYYLSIEAIVSIRFTNVLARNTSLALYIFRLIGIIAFAVTGEQLIFFFPNLFENFFLYCILAQRFAPKLMPKSIKNLIIILLILYIPKFAQEWILHFQQITPWNWFRETVLGVQPN